MREEILNATVDAVKSGDLTFLKAVWGPRACDFDGFPQLNVDFERINFVVNLLNAQQ